MMDRRVTALVLGILLAGVPSGSPAQQSCPGEQCPGDLNCDNAVEITELITAVSSALSGCPALVSPTPTPTVGSGGMQQFPATGQTTCWDTAGNVVPCTGTGQDGDTQAGSLAYTDNGDGTIGDLNTHLMWEKLSHDGSIHDTDNEYTWMDALKTKLATLNEASFAGYSDWRLPNIKELESILNLQNYSPATSTIFNTGCSGGCTLTGCSCTESYGYWSSTTFGSSPGDAWFVNFGNGNVSHNRKTYYFYARAVRGGL